jgi:flagellin
MSSGLKINSAKDDAAGTVISARMAVQLDGNQICQKNIQNANSLLSTAEGNVDVVLDNITRIRDLTLQAKNGTYSKEEKAAMQAEVAQRISEIDRVSDSAKYSQLKLFGDSDANGLYKAGATFQVGANSSTDDTITIAKGVDAEGNDNGTSIFASVKFTDLLGKVKKGGDGEDKDTLVAAYANNAAFDISTMDQAGFVKALDTLDSAIDNLTARKSTIGSLGNRFDSALDTLTTQYTNLTSAKSVITDADIASEACSFTQNQILQQVATSLLSQANQTPSIAMSLL